MYRSSYFAAITSSVRLAVQPYNEEFYCLTNGRIPSQYPISLFVKRNNEFKNEMNIVVCRLIEAGIIDHRFKLLATRKVRKSYGLKPITLTTEYILGAGIILAAGLCIALFVFCIDGQRHFYILTDNPRGRSDNFYFSCNCAKNCRKK